MNMTGASTTPSGRGPYVPGSGLEGSEGASFTPSDLPAPSVAVEAVPRVSAGGARGTAPRWQVMANPTWAVIGGERVVEVADACLLVPRPAPDESGLWMVPTCLVTPMLLAAEKRFGIAVEFVDPQPGTVQGLELVTNHLGGWTLCAVVPEDAPDRIREGVLRERATAQGRPCPCGAPTTVDADARLNATRHYADCPARHSSLRAAVTAWLGP